jgi:hypothetical protein
MELTCLSRETVYLNGKQLDIKKSLKVHAHSPTGFMWGYGGSGPAQLALAVMMEMKPEHDLYSSPHYQKFKKDVISRLPQKPCALEMDFEAWFSGDTDYRFEVRVLDFVEDEVSHEDSMAMCSMPERCQKADWKQCDCACGGANHGVQTKIF